MKTRDQLITDALERAGGLGLNETPTANQITRASSALTSMLKSFHSKGMPLWKITQYSFPMSLFTDGFATMGPGQTLVTSTIPLKLINANRYDTLSQTTINLNIYTRQEYLSIPSNPTAVPTQIYFVPKKTFAEVYLWPWPDSYSSTNVEARIDVQEATNTISLSTDLPDFPEEWEEAIIYGLADREAPHYGLPIEEKKDLARRAKDALEEALSFGNEEGSVYFKPQVRW